MASDDLTTFYKKVRRMILSDEESLFRVLGSIVEVIYVERLENSANYRALLHLKLRIRYTKSIFNLDDFKLLFRNY